MSIVAKEKQDSGSRLDSTENYRSVCLLSIALEIMDRCSMNKLA